MIVKLRKFNSYGGVGIFSFISPPPTKDKKTAEVLVTYSVPSQRDNIKDNGKSSI